LEIVADCFSNDELDLQVNGSGLFAINTPSVKCKTASISISGSGDFNARSIQASSRCDITSNGSGDVDISKLVAPVVNLLSCGCGDCAITDISGVELTVQSNGSGSFECRSGNVFETCNLTSAGSGDMRVALKAENVKAKLVGSGDMRSFQARLAEWL
jgi:hypothetical protein